MNIPRIVIAGTNSGCGKTTVSIGLMSLLSKKGFKVQPFKVGPDYIDPMFHTSITGRYSRNLDSWMLEEHVIKHLFIKNSLGSDIALVEGVMGLYDGLGGYSLTGSTAHVAQIIDAPVILVINGQGMSLSIAALIEGYRNFNRNVNIKGIIINNIKTEHHYKLLKEIIEENTGLMVLGYLPKTEEIALSSRHLGLVTASEDAKLKEKVDRLTVLLENNINLECLIKLAKESDALHSDREINVYKNNTKTRIAVAFDKAFNFYYRDNLDLLEEMGAELIYFSPLNDSKLPDDINGIYIGGGYPEVWARDLQENIALRQDIKMKVRKRLPTYAECGGLMYMTQSIKNKDGNCFEMVGVIPGQSEITSSLQRFGYVEVDVTKDNVIGNAGQKTRAHEFHYSKTLVEGEFETCFNVKKHRKDGQESSWACGFTINNLVAGYPHLHFWSNIAFAKKFIENCHSFNI